MQEEYLLLLLRMIKYGLSSNELLSRGLDYSQIARFITQLLSERMIEEKEDAKQFTLTEDGSRKLEELEKKIFPRLKRAWLLPEYKERIEKADPLEIYLPEGMD